MSADSPRRGLHKGAQVISPQPINDRSIIDSVAGIINDIVPQAYAGIPASDNKETITWARFEYGDVNDPSLFPDYIEGSSTPPLLLVLGYATGVQVWIIAASGEATEVLSWRQGVVRTLRILPDPLTDEDHPDPYEKKRPIVAICDSAGPGPQFCSVSFISLKTGEQTKSIKFKNPVCDVLANKRSVIVTFSEKIAVFDARTFDDVLTVTTCYLSPGPNPNPVALGTRWLAYSEKKLLPARRSSGGSEGEGVQSYTAAVLYAAKSLGKGLRGLGETVASSLTGTTAAPLPLNNAGGDVTQPGVITILDLQAAKEEKELDDPTMETVVAHFTAHSDAIVAMTFDQTGAILMTADRRGHDFHVFRIQPHPGGPTLAAVHHLYVLHRGDTTAKVQDMVFSSDTRWAAVSTVRGTTHVFPVAPYGGPVGMRTHSTPHVVNRLSRFHRSAGLTDDGTRSHSPVSHTEMPISAYPYSNPRLPPYPHPTILHPLAQIRQPSALNHTNNQTQPSRPQQRQRLHSDDNGTLPLKICACFAPPRAWIYSQRDSTSKVSKRAVDSLFIMACHGNMIQYDLEPKPAAGIPKEKVCDDTMIELEVEAKGQWPLLRIPNSLEVIPPLPSSSPLLCYSGSPKNSRQMDTAEDRWLSQVEIVTHAGPHRRLWMGPQFVFKTYNAPSGVNLVESEAVEIGVTGGSRPARSNPVNMPHAAARPLVPVVIDGSGSSYEQSPRFMEAYGDSLGNETMDMGNGENQLRVDLAEAMLDISGAANRVPGGSQSVASCEDLSSSSFSSASRASLDARSSPTPSCATDHMLVFPGDSSGSI
uniref:CG43154_0 protein n=1 Tax=Fopius arisanus TaxID=64838 RepID=A0A0C9RK46_9HYME